MKKIIMGLAFAAALFCGCQKMNDLESRMKAAESDISSLKSDVAKLQAAVESHYSISSVQQTADGYVLNLSNGSSITLRDGKDGKDGEDGDAFFKSVTSEDGVVVITLVDGSVYRLNLAEDYPLKAVKSLTYIPAYEDGFATVKYFTREDASVEMKFMIKPASSSVALMNAIEAGTLKLTPLAAYPATRALADEVTELVPSSYGIEPDGLLEVKVNASGLSSDFFEDKSGAAIAVVISDGVSEISSAFVPLNKECSGLEYGGVVYHTAKMADGKVWMTENLRYVPEGYTPCGDISNVTGGVYLPVVLNAAGTAAVFGTAADVRTQGYLYQTEVALGVKVGDIRSADDARALEGTRGICPEGWHIPTLSDYFGLVGKSAGVETNPLAPYNNGTDGSVAMLNEDGFDLFACGSVSIIDNTRTSGTLAGRSSIYDHLTSGYMCGSTYAGTTERNGAVSNIDFFGLVTLTNKPTEAEYTANGARIGYRNAVSVRCVKD